jgi:hypothetical protein
MEAFSDSLISDKAGAFDVSSWHLKTSAKLTLAENHVKLVSAWRRLVSGITHRYQIRLLKKSQRRVRNVVYSETVSILWNKFVKYCVGEAQRVRLELFRKKLDELVTARSENIRLQWNAFRRALLDQEEREQLRELWVSLVFVKKKRLVRAAAIRFQQSSMHNTVEWQRGWRELATRMALSDRISSLHRRAAAIRCLTGFFTRALAKSRVSQAVEHISLHTWDAQALVEPHLRDACGRINRFAKLWLRRKAGRFAVAYADEIFTTAFVHLAGNIVPNS